jgi:hypothetical protein
MLAAARQRVVNEETEQAVMAAVRGDVAARERLRAQEGNGIGALLHAPGPGESLLQTANPFGATINTTAPVSPAVGGRPITLEERHAVAQDWLRQQLTNRRQEPLKGDGKSFLDWAVQTYGEFMRKRDGGGDEHI